MTYSFVRNLVLVVSISFILTACSGGESGTGLTASHPNISVGAITGFGSVFVNGVEFDTSSADIYVNDASATEQDLSIGMVVAVVGSSNQAQTTGKAVAIYYENEVRGIVVKNDQAGSMEIIGQSVNYDAESLFESSVDAIKTIEDIPAGAMVEVSGYRIGENILHATHLVLLDTAYSTGGQITVKGIVNSVNEDRFILGNITVATDTSTQFASNIPNQQLTSGMNITVKSQSGLSNGELLADKIQLNKKEYAVTGASVEIEGIVMNVDSPAGEFLLNDYWIYYSSQTEFNGRGAVLADGVKAEVEGVLISDNQIEAKKIKFRIKNNTDLIARVNSVNVADNQVSVLGVTIQINNNTLMKDDDQDIKKFSLADVSPNDKIEIKAYKDTTSSTITASQFIRLKSQTTDTAVELKGVLEQYSTTKIVVADIPVDINGISPPPEISAADIGRTITVKGTALDNASEITATEVSN